MPILGLVKIGTFSLDTYGTVCEITERYLICKATSGPSEGPPTATPTATPATSQAVTDSSPATASNIFPPTVTADASPPSDDDRSYTTADLYSDDEPLPPPEPFDEEDIENMAAFGVSA